MICFLYSNDMFSENLIAKNSPWADVVLYLFYSVALRHRVKSFKVISYYWISVNIEPVMNRAPMNRAPPEYDRERFYLRKQYYTTKTGEHRISYSLINRTARSTKRGPAFRVNIELTQEDYDRIRNLREYNAPWKNIASSFGTSAYHIKKLYNNFNAA